MFRRGSVGLRRGAARLAPARGAARAPGAPGLRAGRAPRTAAPRTRPHCAGAAAAEHRVTPLHLGTPHSCSKDSAQSPYNETKTGRLQLKSVTVLLY